MTSFVKRKKDVCQLLRWNRALEQARERERPHLRAPLQRLSPPTTFSNNIGTLIPVSHVSPGVGWLQGKRPFIRQEA